MGVDNRSRATKSKQERNGRDRKEQEDMKITLLPPAYLGSIYYYACLTGGVTLTDAHSHYIKQTAANRCNLLTSNGIQTLSIPVEKSEKTAIKDIKISTHDNWQQLHWRALESAYNSSPFYEFFCDEYRPFFEKKWTFLLDFDIEIEKKTLELLNYKDVNIELSTRYIEEGEDTIIDLRKELQPKKFDVSLHNELTLPYYQVFDNKYGFTPNLSIVDLLFNMGNESKIYIKKIQKTI